MMENDVTTLKRFGDLKEGDVIRGSKGEPVRVTRAYDEHIPEKMYEIETENDVIVKASGNHLWYVETTIDRALHRERKKKGKKLFSKLSPEIIESLVFVAENEEPVETSLMDMVSLVEGENNDEVVKSLVRIAESLGHIVEENVKYENLLTGETEYMETIRAYDARLFCQQILSLTGRKEYKKKYPLIVGSVINTEKMFELYKMIDIPVMRMLES